MKRILLLATLVALLASAAIPARSEAAVSVGVSLHVGDPYRGLSLHLRSEPDMALIPATRVYRAQDFDRDLYRYGRDWYYVDDDYWYRASSYRGPFVRVDVSSVPREIWSVPAGYRTTWGGPPDHAPAYGYRRNHDQGGYGYGRYGQGGYRSDSRGQGGWQRGDRRYRDGRDGQRGGYDRYGGYDRSGGYDRNGN